MLEYCNHKHDESSTLGKKTVSPFYYEEVDSLYVTIEKLNEKGSQVLDGTLCVIIG